MKTITGDLLAITSGTVLHQVNCFGATGGLAGALRRKWPVAFDDYLAYCDNEGRDMLGRFVLGDAAHSLSIGHVFGQMYPGPNTDMAAVRRSLAEARDCVTSQVYAPYKMGCSLGGGNWPEYLEALVEVFPEIIIVQREGDL